MKINYFDLFVLIVIFLTAFTSLIKGFVIEFFSFISLLGIIFLSVFSSKFLIGYFQKLIGSFIIARLLSLVISFFFFYIIYRIVVYPLLFELNDKANEGELSGFNRFGGFIFGVLKGILFIVIILIFYVFVIREIKINELNRLIDSSISYKVFNLFFKYFKGLYK